MIHRLVTTIVVAGCLALPLHASAGKKPRVTPGPYNGLFVSGCDNIAEGLYTRDLMSLKQYDAQINATYDKAFYVADDCKDKSLLVTLRLPPVTWKLEGQTQIEGKPVDQVAIHLRGGMIKATIAQTDKVTETEDMLVLKVGDEDVPISKMAERSVDRDLRQLIKNQLRLGDPEAMGADGYPQSLLPNVFIRQAPQSHPPIPLLHKPNDDLSSLPQDGCPGGRDRDTDRLWWRWRHGAAMGPRPQD